MFLKKITGIKGVGRFRTGRVNGGEYSKYTLIYGGNGRGKTTLCAVLRSLQRNDPGIILKRKSFGVPAAQEVQLLLDGGIVRFGGGKWSASAPDIHIFDQEFIKENVHGGHRIDVEHRRNFYRIAVGPKGVELAKEIEALDAAATAKQSEIANERKVLQQHVPNGMTLDNFLKLPRDDSVNEKITGAERTLKAVENAVEIASHATLTPVSLPSFPADFTALLLKGVDGVSAEATTMVQDHLKAHEFDASGEKWLGTGVKHIRQNDCPFCGAALEGNKLIVAFQGYFSAAYARHQIELETLTRNVKASFSQAAIIKVSQGFKDAGREADFWGTYVDHGFQVTTAANRVECELTALTDAAFPLLDAKLAAPLKPIPMTPAFEEALWAWAKTREELDASNTGIAKANESILAAKKAAADANKASAQVTLAKLRAIKLRWAAPFAELAVGYEKLLKEKDQLVVEKEAKKRELDLYDAAVLSAHEAEINRILTTFNAGFRLAKCAKNYIGKTPQSAYYLRFGDADVDVSKIDGDDPTFETTMSAGDKSTFALAFFLAQLNRDGALPQKVVVFDDPFTSLDDFRREMTAKALVRVGESAAQVIVFSHDKYFLDAVRQKIHGVPCSAMQISVTAGNSVIETWDIAREVREGYLRDHMALMDFADGFTTDAKPMRTVMRPLLEKYIRYRFPNKIKEGLWLGEMLAIIRDEPSHPLRPHYTDLDDINEYTAPFHHDPNTAFNDDEVLAYVKRTLTIVGGC